MNPFDWPTEHSFSAKDAEGTTFTVTVKRHPGESGHTIGGGSHHIASEKRAYFLADGTRLQCSEDDEEVFTVVTTSKVIRKI